MAKGALPAAQIPECPAAAILSPRALFRLTSSLFVSEPKLVVSMGQKPNFDSPEGHHAFRSLCAESGAALSVIAPRVRRERRESQEEAATAMAPSHAPRRGLHLRAIIATDSLYINWTALQEFFLKLLRLRTK
ncbi:hypothetical protein NDU88_006981 [Pleurodeles waltl]|uniref:Uncharacterized protein n=1 Tax=Pleurodeles waltl TaxID=8319 RepID=A0AAV7RNT2_PLEWA|nr:hypothetical protein NDU88_006981 [Pleurodeles waltl]